MTSSSPISKDPSTPPPIIGKIGPYTVFMTPPPTPKPQFGDDVSVSPSPKKVSPVMAPPVKPPPPQYVKKSYYGGDDGSVLGFFKNAATKVHNAHMSLDDRLARWFGLNQSKYQWALDDYYDAKGLEKEEGKVKGFSSKV
ncbi:hypothetical protein ACFE04_009523 [Oxalis oulophora]